MITALMTAVLVLSGYMALAWLVQRRTGNSGWIDAIWTFAVATAAIIALKVLNIGGARTLVTGGLVTLWALRLGVHIVARTRRSADDPRYAKLMEEWGASAPAKLFVFLQVQALAGSVLVLAVLLAAEASETPLSIGWILFSLLALASIIGEGVADAQLAAWKRSKVINGICEIGLWSYSRHPNYFFEWLFWFAIAGIALTPPSSVWDGLAILAPIMMYALLRHGSGVPHLEAHMERTRAEAFSTYKQRVPVFFPRLW
ncbi:COG3752 Steroid 5-alpha reductase family enzyme [Rhabdaerophilaceae bacterium]